MRAIFPGLDLGGLERYRVRPGCPVPSLTQFDPRDRAGLPGDKDEVSEAAKKDIAEIAGLQKILYSENKRAVLVLVQGTDASGKDGAIKKVLASANPIGLAVTSFKPPTKDELAHDFLWRIHKAVPPKRMIGVFNRSHYEDVTTVHVRGLVPPETVETRYGQINCFEDYLVQNDVTLVKFFLHISSAEQAKRLGARLVKPSKQWKYDPADIAGHEQWDAYMEAYRRVLERCSTEHAPWIVVPADRKWYRNAVMARVLRRVLETLDPKYPELSEPISSQAADQIPTE